MPQSLQLREIIAQLQSLGAGDGKNCIVQGSAGVAESHGVG
jgi:hypothetical protein